MRRWQQWAPKTEKTEVSPDDEPTKPTKPGFVGFEGDPPADYQKIRSSPEVQRPASSSSPAVTLDCANPLIPEDGTSKTYKTYKTTAQVAVNLRGLAGRGSAELPTRRCRACNSWLFWVSVYGTVVCSTCHPPASRDLVQEWYWLPESEGKTPQ